MEQRQAIPDEAMELSIGTIQPGRVPAPRSGVINA
jgi:hypothetical protein